MEAAPCALTLGWDERGIRIPLGVDLGLEARDGDRLTVFLPIGCDPDLIVHTALGPGLAACWTLRGLPVIHGSSVSIGGRAASIVGPAGRGKSTLAAQLHLRGHRVISDGSTLLSADAGILWAHPGPSWFKLDEVSLRALGREPAHHAPVRAGARKRIWDLVTELAPNSSVPPGSLRPVPLARIYVLEDDDRPRIQPLGGSQAARRIFENMYLLPFLPAGAAPRLLRQAASVARRCRVSLLQRPRRFEFAEDALELVERDASGLEGDCSGLPEIAGPAREPDGTFEEPRR